LNKKKVKYSEIDIAVDSSKMIEMQKKTNGARTIPQIFIGETYVGGYDELKSLELAGKLNSLLGI
jgi:glutaredoxin 3